MIAEDRVFTAGSDGSSCRSWTYAHDLQNPSLCLYASSGLSRTVQEFVRRAPQPNSRAHSIQGLDPNPTRPVPPRLIREGHTCRKSLAKRRLEDQNDQCSIRLLSSAGCYSDCFCGCRCSSSNSKQKLPSWMLATPIHFRGHVQAYDLRGATGVSLKQIMLVGHRSSGFGNEPFTLAHRLQHPWSQVARPTSPHGALNSRFERSDGIVHQPV